MILDANLAKPPLLGRTLHKAYKEFVKAALVMQMYVDNSANQYIINLSYPFISISIKED
jgi:hypothetical protein